MFRATWILSPEYTDGAWNMLDTYYIDSDIRVAYGYVPTYMGCGILMVIDQNLHFSASSKEMEMLDKGLNFAKGRSLHGSGFGAYKGLMNAMEIFERSGIYHFFNGHQETALEFQRIWNECITGIKRDLEANNTVFDFATDYRKEMEKRMAAYNKDNNPIVLKEKEYVWYGCYGSNINETRFMRYINNCTDKTKPVESRAYIFPYPVYMAASAGNWSDKAVAFLDDTTEGKAYGRIYKITNEQYEQVKIQEGSKYTKRIELPEIDGLTVVTFTSEYELPQP